MAKRAPNTVYESREYDRLVGRKFKPYSSGHRAMYTTAIEGIKLVGMEAHIFEAGFGIGWGLQQMLSEGIVRSYVGCEPNIDSYKYVAEEPGLNLEGKMGVSLIHGSFDQVLADAYSGSFNEAFCIEVIEHVPMDQHLEFLIALRQMAPRLWFSTADKTKSREGVRTVGEWTTLLKQARFETVKVNASHWTYLYECR